MKEIIYISIPISGKCEATQRRLAYLYQRHFERMGKEVINPFELGDALRAKKKNPTWQDYMDLDLLAIKKYATEIFLCNGWADSRGCMEEVDAGIKKGVKFLCESWLRWGEIK